MNTFIEFCCYDASAIGGVAEFVKYVLQSTKKALWATD